MAVGATNAFSGPYTGNGATTAFPFSFKAMSADEVAVFADGVLVTFGYTVALTVDAEGNLTNGGTVTFGSPLSSGTVLYIASDPSFTQEIGFQNAGAFLPASHDEANDREAIRDIFLRGRIDRAIIVPELGSTAHAEALAGWDAAGDPALYQQEGLTPTLVTGVAAVPTRAAMAGLTSTSSPRYLAESGREGLFAWSSANLSTLVAADPQQGVYVAPALAPTGASGAWVRKFSGPLEASWFGAVANDPGTGAFGTDAYPAFAAMALVSAALAIVGYVNSTIYRGGLPCHIGKGGYYCSQSIAPLFTGEVYGDGGKGWGAPTRIRMAAGADGLQLQAYNTSGKTTFDGANHYSGDRIHVHDIAFIGAYSGTESDTHGIRGKRAGTIERCTFDGFEGDGLYCNTTFNSGIGSTEGNVNAMRVIDCDFQNCRRGRYLEGDDANAVAFIGCSYINNRQAGIDEEGFLGNGETGEPHLDGNARTADNVGTAAKPASYCSKGGYRYFVIRGNEAGAASNGPVASTVTITIASPAVVSWTAHGLAAGTEVAFSTTGALPTGLAANTTYYVVNPTTDNFQVSATYGGAAINTSGSQSGTHTSGAGKDNTWWGYWEAGGVSTTTGVPAYAGGMTWRPGGPVLQEGASNSSSILGIHVESNGVSQIDQGMIIIGTHYIVHRVTGGVLFRDRASTMKSSSDGLVIGGVLAIRGDLNAGSASNIIGPYRGPVVQDGTLNYATRSTQVTINFRPYDINGNPGTAWLSIASGSGFGRSNDFAGGMFDRWKINGNERFKIDDTGAIVAAGKNVFIGGTKVLGNGSVTTANASDLATAITLVNAIKALMNT